MKVRRAYRAGSFYPADGQGCRELIAECLGAYQPPAEPPRVVAGIVPHAGWVFSGPTAAKVFRSVKDKAAPQTFVIFGAVHVWGMGRQAALCAEGEWETPCGNAVIDHELAAEILKACPKLVADEPSAHTREHSIEVQIPFIQYLFPTAQIVPIMVNPDHHAADIGRHVGERLASYPKPVVVLGSTDLTHYGPSFDFTPDGVGAASLAPMKANDQRIIDLIASMQAEAVLAEADEHRNACGAGAIAATIAVAKALGAARGYLLEHTTSQDVMPERPASDFVGYAGMIF